MAHERHSNHFPCDSLEYITLWDLQKYSMLPVNVNQV